MAKNVEITNRIEQLIIATQGDDIDFSTITVFEAAAASNRPLDKEGSLFDGAIMGEDLLRAMAEGLNRGDFAVPLHTLHQKGFELPVGRVFHAEVLAVDDGKMELRSLFYLDQTQHDLVERIQSATIDEVSVGIKSQQMLCSECGFDFMGPDADFDNLFNQTCCNDHVIGEEGVFVRLIGLDKWLELSLVSTGASDKPKILGRVKQRLGEEAFARIAADGSIPEAVVLYATMKGFDMSGDKKSGENKVDLTPITEALAATTATLATLTASMEAITADIAVLKAVAPASAEGEDTPEVKLEVANAALETAKTDLTAAQAEVETLKASETELKSKVTALEAAAGLPAGGASASAITDAKSSVKSAGRLAAFRASKTS